MGGARGRVPGREISDEYLLRERDIHALAAQRAEPDTGLYL
jgi:hypothetical protein